VKEDMAVKIRLKRIGAKKSPFYRVVVADARYPRDGRFIEEIGTYNPLVDPAEIKIDIEKADKWIKNGAQPTDTVKALIKKIKSTGGQAETVVEAVVEKADKEVVEAAVEEVAVEAEVVAAEAEAIEGE